MSETLEERIRNIAKENFNMGEVKVYASDIVEILDNKDDVIKWLSSTFQDLINNGWLDEVEFEKNCSFDELKTFIDETVKEYGRYEEDGSS
jgi:hypothetical protein